MFNVVGKSKLTHRSLTRMSGRDPAERHRTATNLELFFDLTFVVVFSLAGVQLADTIAEGHLLAAILGFGFCAWAAIWAWINFTWMASAFDTDDWLFRIVTMLQMIGVCVLALGAEPVFRSVSQGEAPDNAIVVLGYVIMRVALLAHWGRVALASRKYRRSAVAYIVAILVAQVGWVLTAVIPVSMGQLLAAAAVLYVVELSGPVIAERIQPTPWHPHHIAERYGLLTIITLGEGVVGLVTALQALVKTQGWSSNVVTFGVAAMVVNLALWWIYFSIPTGEALERSPKKSFTWGYGHMIIFMAVAAFGAGLHVAALSVEHETHVSEFVVAAAFILPLAAAVLGIAVMDLYLTGLNAYRIASVMVTFVLLGGGLFAVAKDASPLTAIVWAAGAMAVQVLSNELTVLTSAEGDE